MKGLKEFAVGIAMSIIIPIVMAVLLLLFTGVIEVQAEETDYGDLYVTYVSSGQSGTVTQSYYVETNCAYDLVRFYYDESSEWTDLYSRYIKNVYIMFFKEDIPNDFYVNTHIVSSNGSVTTKNYDSAYLFTATSDSGKTYYIFNPCLQAEYASDTVSCVLSYSGLEFPTETSQLCQSSQTAYNYQATLYVSYEPPVEPTYNSDIPTPQVVLNQMGKLAFNNKTDNYYFELQGRWRTAEDIDIYSENLVWKYKFQSRIDSDLTTWVSQDDRRLATEADLYLTQLGADNFATLLSSHPSIERNIYTSNALGEVLSGFSSQKAQFINYLDNCAFFPINSPEIYVRYYTVDDSGNVEYGRWCHAYVTMPTNGKMSTFTDDLTDGFAYVSTQSDKGLTDDEFTYVEDLEDSRLETDASISNNADGSVYVPDANMDTSQLLNVLTSMFEQSKAFFYLFAQVFSFFPEWLTGLIFSSLGVMVVIGVWKFIRG